jgi:hypothetical protein
VLPCSRVQVEADKILGVDGASVLGLSREEYALRAAPCRDPGIKRGWCLVMLRDPARSEKLTGARCQTVQRPGKTWTSQSCGRQQVMMTTSWPSHKLICPECRLTLGVGFYWTCHVT